MQCLSRQQKEEMSFTSTLNGSVAVYLSLRLASFVPRSARWVLPPNSSNSMVSTAAKPAAKRCPSMSIHLWIGHGKAADGVPGCPRPHTLPTARYSALYRQPNARQKVRPAFEGPDFLVGRENVFAQSAAKGRQRGHVFILAGGM